MPKQKFLIAPLGHGSQANLKPWLIMDDAYALQRNMYTWRGSVVKRFGSRYMNEGKTSNTQQQFSRLRILIGSINAGTGAQTGTVPGTIFKIGQMFSVGDTMLTVVTAGVAQPMLTTVAGQTGTFSTTNGAWTLAGFPLVATSIYWYPSEPVMELATFRTATNPPNDSTLIAFDSQFSYYFIFGSGWNILGGVPPAVGSAIWDAGSGAPHATTAHFYWTTNYQAVLTNAWSLFVTNNVPTDGFKYWTPTSQADPITGTWTTLGTALTTPINGGGDYLVTCGVLIGFQGRLLAMDVVANISAVNIRYNNTIFFSKIGDPASADSWLQESGLGGFLILPVQETIIGAQLLKNQLIIYCEQSTWELVFQGNVEVPFRFQKINTELGVESAASIVPFDKVVLGIGAVGIHACNGLNVERIDEIIPYTVFDIANSNLGPKRVNGVRDYFLELVYWSYPSGSIQPSTANIFPNRVIVFDYINETWAYNDDSITALGNFQLQQSYTWADLNVSWEEYAVAWNSGSLADRFNSVIAGNQQGFTFITDPYRPSNARVLSITNLVVADDLITLTVVDHNLLNDSFIYIDNIQGSGTLTNLNGRIFQIGVRTDMTTGSYSTIFFNALNTNGAVLTGTYSGGGTLARVSEPEIITKQYDFFNKVGLQIAVNRVDFYVDKSSTGSGQMTIDFYVSSSNQSLLNAAIASGALLGTSVLPTSALALNSLESTQDRFWHSVYFQAQGENVQLKIYMTPEQMLNPQISLDTFELNAMIFHATPTSDFAS